MDVKNNVSDSVPINVHEFNIMAWPTFLYINYGIILSVILAIGIPGNFIALAVLLHRSLQSAPVCILKVLTIIGIINMLYSIHADVFPALQTYKDTLALHTYLPKDTRNYFILRTSSAGKNNSSAGSYEEEYLQTASFYSVLPKQHDNGHMNTKNVSSDRNISLDLFQEIPISNLENETEISIPGAIDRFIGCTIIFLGLMVTLCLALERCIAIYCPLRAARWLTIHKTRVTLAWIIAVCILIHLPQLIIEVYCVKANRTFTGDRDTLLDPVRKNYDQFFVIAGLIICMAIFVLNITLLAKLISFHKKFRACKHIRHSERTEINITVAIVVLVFFQLPFHIFATIIAFISKHMVLIDLTTFLKVAVVFRVLYVTQCAFNFVIYCLLARNCRRVVLLMFRKISSSINMANNDEPSNSSGKKSFNDPRDSMKLKRRIGVEMVNKAKKVQTVVITEYTGQFISGEHSV